MTRRKYEFKPDRTETGPLSRLYLTKKQRLSLLKWLLFGLVLLVLSVLQDVVMSRLNILGATTDLLPCASLLAAVILGPETGSVFCLVASALYQLSGSAPGVYAIPLITALGVAAGIFRLSYFRSGFSTALICTTGALVLYELAVWAMGIFLGQTRPDRVTAFLLTGAMTLVTVPVLYPMMRSIGKIGGEAWKE